MASTRQCSGWTSAIRTNRFRLLPGRASGPDLPTFFLADGDGSVAIVVGAGLVVMKALHTSPSGFLYFRLVPRIVRITREQ